MEMILSVLLVVLSLGVTGANAQIVSPKGITAGVGDGRYVNVTGDTMTGALAITANSFSVGTSTFVVSAGKVGVGVSPAFSNLQIPYNTTDSQGYFGGIELQGYDVSNNWIMSNLRYNSGYKYRANGKGGSLSIGDGILRWDTVASGVAGNSATLTNRFFIGDTGLVGIGTTAPDTKLHISSGTIKVDGTDAGISVVGTSAIISSGGSGNPRVTATNGTEIVKIQVVSGSFGLVGMQSNHPMVLATGDVERVRLTAGGGTRLYSRTKAQILAIDPIEAGEQFYCSDCTASNICISTGTAVGQFSDIQAKSVACQ